MPDGAAARASEWPPKAAARSTREGVSRPERSDGRLTRLGRREDAVLCGAGLKGAAARWAEATQAPQERVKRATRSAASVCPPRGWGFGGVHSQFDRYRVEPSGGGFGGVHSQFDRYRVEPSGWDFGGVHG